MFEYLEIEIDERTGVNRIRLDRAERRNALSGALVAELKEALALAEADARVRVIGVGGRGPDFCAGADLAEVQASVEEGVMASLRDAEALGGDACIGLAGMRERAALVGGTVVVQSAPGEGTTVRVSVPAKGHEPDGE